MYTKKYWLLMPPFFLFGMLLLIVLPKDNWPLVLLVPLIFWGVYYWQDQHDRKNKD